MNYLKKKFYLFFILTLISFLIIIFIILPPSTKSNIHNAYNNNFKIITHPFRLIYDKKYNYNHKNYKLNIIKREKLENNQTVTVNKYELEDDIISGAHVLNLNIFDTEFLSIDDNKYIPSNMPYIDFLDNETILMHYSIGNFALFNHSENSFKKIQSNYCSIIKKHSFNDCINETEFGIRDIFLDDNNKLYVSSYFSSKNNSTCKGLMVFESEPIDINNPIIFKLFYKTPSCIKEPNPDPSGGRIQRIDENNILLSIGDFQPSHTDILKKNEQAYKNNHVSQDPNSHFGKTILIDNQGTSSIYSLGNRNPQGLYIKGEYVIGSEHGPNGGDEINILYQGRNYGWPVVSYGFAYNEDIEMSKSHEYPYEEPIYYFSPSIGISEIIVYNNDYFKRWTNKTLVASLVSNSLYIVNIDYENKHANNMDKIFLGDITIKDSFKSLDFRIRDMKVSNDGKIWLITDDNYIGYIEKSKNDFKGP